MFTQTSKNILQKCFSANFKVLFLQDLSINIKDISDATFLENVLQNDVFNMPVVVNWSKIFAFKNEKKIKKLKKKCQDFFFLNLKNKILNSKK